MVQCDVCSNQLPSKIIFQSNGFGQYFLAEKQKHLIYPILLIQQSDYYYQASCSQQCLVKKITNMPTVQIIVEENFEMIFQKSQISNGIINQMQNLNSLLKQEIILTENVYKQKSNFNVLEQFRTEISQSIKDIIAKLLNDISKHLEEAIQFSMSEIEKINIIKQQVQKLLNEQGNINLLDHKNYVMLCEQDIKKYRVDEMIQLMEKLEEAKKKINQTLSEKLEQ